MILEDYLDKIAYPLKRTVTHPGMSMAEMAKLEMKCQGMRPGALPPSVDKVETSAGVAAREKIMAFMADAGSATVPEITEGTGMGRPSLRNHLATLVASGKLHCKRRKGLHSVYSVVV